MSIGTADVFQMYVRVFHRTVEYTDYQRLLAAECPLADTKPELTLIRRDSVFTLNFKKTYEHFVVYFNELSCELTAKVVHVYKHAAVHVPFESDGATSTITAWSSKRDNSILES